MCTPGATRSTCRGARLLRVGGEAGHLVVAEVGRSRRVRRAEREDVRVEARVRERGDLALPLIAVVSSGRDDDDPVEPGLLRGKRERVERVGLEAVRPVGEVEHADVQTWVVCVLYHPVDRRDDLRHVRPSVRIGDLERDDPRAGRHAQVGRGRRLAARRGVPSGDQSGHERAVAVGVEVAEVRRLRLEREVRAVDDLLRARQALHGRDAGVDHRHIDALAGVAGAPPVARAGQRRDRAHRIAVGRGIVRRPAEGRALRLQMPVRGHGEHVSARAQRRDATRRQRRREAADDREGQADGAAELLDERLGRRFVPGSRAHDHVACAAGGGGGRARGRRADRGSGRAREDDGCEGEQGYSATERRGQGRHVGSLLGGNMGMRQRSL